MYSIGPSHEGGQQRDIKAAVAFEKSHPQFSKRTDKIVPRILIVDENEDNRDVLARRLQLRGFDISVAIGGREAIKQASDAGCSDYHTKSVQLEKLTALIEALLADSAK